MKLNNKGFAITGILYGLLILFVLCISSYLLILTSKKNRLDILTEEIEQEEGFNTCFYKDDDSGDCKESTMGILNSAPYSGKYILSVNGKNCYAYLPMGTLLTQEITCQDDSGNIVKGVPTILYQIYY